MKKILVVLLALGTSFALFSQNEVKKWAVGGGISAIDFSGPITKSYFDFEEYKGSGRFFVGRYLNPSFNTKVDFSFGKVWYPAFNAYPDVIPGLYNLRHIYDAGLTFEYKFNNGYIFQEKAVFAPYMFTGIGVNNIVDYDVNTYVPFGIGFNIRPSNWFTINIQSAYKLNIDNSFDYTQHTASLVFNIGSTKGLKKIDEDAMLDSDGDGIPDLLDECPFTPGLPEFFGCPDSDGDGIGDSRDLCPHEPGPVENRGCPIIDTDGDGIPDDQDACPFEFGEKRYAGCPDTDGDGIIDKYDKCPTVPGPASNDGCPLEEEEAPAPAKPAQPEPVKETPKEPVKETPKAPVKEEVKAPVKEEPKTPVRETPKEPAKPAPAPPKDGVYVIFYPIGAEGLTNADKKLIDEALALLEANPSWKVKISGYTDNSGNDVANVELSLRRAQNVWRYMSSKGLDGRRVEIYGMGEYFPQSSTNANENRRVEIELVK
jgi:OmpA-OmpF porin, OOP family